MAHEKETKRMIAQLKTKLDTYNQDPTEKHFLFLGIDENNPDPDQANGTPHLCGDIALLFHQLLEFRTSLPYDLRVHFMKHLLIEDAAILKDAQKEIKANK